MINSTMLGTRVRGIRGVFRASPIFIATRFYVRLDFDSPPFPLDISTVILRRCNTGIHVIQVYTRVNNPD